MEKSENQYLPFLKECDSTGIKKGVSNASIKHNHENLLEMKRICNKLFWHALKRIVPLNNKIRSWNPIKIESIEVLEMVGGKSENCPAS